ncbi:MAG: PmoA family protein [Planctomycetaceae bacterium]|nr:PmoA family protein [Planctomycetaceae bacterium]
MRIFFTFISFCFLTGLVPAADAFRFEEQPEKQLALFDGEQPVFVYQYDAILHQQVPDNSARKFAGCYIHPLYGLNGEILTDNAPKDHYHHHGVFWTYPHVGVHEPDGTVKEYNTWEGRNYPALRQRFVKWIDKKTAGDTAVFEVENGWFITESPEALPVSENKLMYEVVKVTVHKVKAEGMLKSRAIDIELTWKPTQKPISLRGAEAKSYGGLTVRFKPFVQEKNQKRTDGAVHDEINAITVPDGITPIDLPEKPLAWADYTSLFGDSKTRSGAAIFVPKTHPDYPPTWLTRYYGALCIGWPGVKDKTFQVGEEIKLNYRIWIHNEPVSLQQLEKVYEKYIR